MYEPSADVSAHADKVMDMARRSGSPTAIALAYWAEGQVAAIEDRNTGTEVWKLGLEWAQSLPGSHLVEHLLVGLILHFSARDGDLKELLRLCSAALRSATQQHYLAGTSHLFGVTAIALCRSGDPETGARLAGAMIANGHTPRRNAMRALEQALGDKLEILMAAGRPLTTSRAADVAIDAIERAAANLQEQPT